MERKRIVLSREINELVAYDGVGAEFKLFAYSEVLGEPTTSWIHVIPSRARRQSATSWSRRQSTRLRRCGVQTPGSGQSQATAVGRSKPLGRLALADPSSPLWLRTRCPRAVIDSARARAGVAEPLSVVSAHPARALARLEDPIDERTRS